MGVGLVWFPFFSFKTLMGHGRLHDFHLIIKNETKLYLSLNCEQTNPLDETLPNWMVL
jgi:hypothetical protein